MHEILLVEDDPVLGRGLSVNLELANYKVHWAQTLQAAGLELLQRQVDLIVLDLNLPDGHGLTLLQKLRDEGSRVAVVILTAETDEDSVVAGLQAGANDYVRKPFGNKEFLARVKAALRDPAQAPQLRYGDLAVKNDDRTITYKNQILELNRREFDILSFMIRRAEAVVTRATLLEALGAGDDIFDRTIDSHVSHLRARFRQADVTGIQITSVYGLGYRLEKK